MSLAAFVLAYLMTVSCLCLDASCFSLLDLAPLCSVLLSWCHLFESHGHDAVGLSLGDLTSLGLVWLTWHQRVESGWRYASVFCLVDLTQLWSVQWTWWHGSGLADLAPWSWVWWAWRFCFLFHGLDASCFSLLDLAVATVEKKYFKKQ